MNESPVSERSPEVLEAMSTSELVKGVVDETRSLVKLEIALAKEEVVIELKQMERAGIAAAIALLTTILLLAMLSVAIVLAFGGTAIAALLVAACFLVITGGLGAYAYGAAPKKPLEKTRRRLEADVNQLKEHIA